jgi:hypothetical protein
MPLILGTNSIKDTGYEVANSLRFDGASNDYLNRSFSSGTGTTFTVSAWIKRSNLNQSVVLLSSGANSSNDLDEILIQTDGTFRAFSYTSSYTFHLTSNALFRDVSAWYHFMFVYDSTNSTSGDRARMYVNGSEITSFSAEVQPSQSTVSNYFNKNREHYISGNLGSTDTGTHYIAEYCFIDGQALDPTSFGEFDSDTNIWKPIDVSGLTFGTNGFYLDFENSSSLGADVSGNGNNFTVNNLTSVDQTTDTCTNNFATINPLDNFFAQATLSEGNTKVVTDSSAEAMSTSTFAMTKGKWYMEADFISGAGARMCGITPTVSFQTSSHGKAGDVTPHTVTYIGGGSVQEGNGSGGQTLLASYASYSTGDIIGIYMDLDNMKAYLSKNGTLQSSTGIDLEPLASNGTGHYMFFVGDNNSGSLTCEANFGNGFQSLSSAVTDDNGYGAFEYSPNITGDGESKSFYSCCTKNLAEFG